MIFNEEECGRLEKHSRSDLLSILPKGRERVLLDLGCGTRKKEGYIGIDLKEFPGVDIVCDINKGIPVEGDSVDGVYSNFMFEHVSNTIFLFQELFRVCRNEARIEFIVPSCQSVTQYKDPTHKNIILPEMMPYFSTSKWYGSDYGINVDFKLLDVKYFYLPPFDKLLRRRYFFLYPILYPFLMFARRFLWNVVHSIAITIEVVK